MYFPKSKNMSLFREIPNVYMSLVLPRDLLLQGRRWFVDSKIKNDDVDLCTQVIMFATASPRQAWDTVLANRCSVSLHICKSGLLTSATWQPCCLEWGSLCRKIWGVYRISCRCDPTERNVNREGELLFDSVPCEWIECHVKSIITLTTLEWQLRNCCRVPVLYLLVLLSTFRLPLHPYLRFHNGRETDYIFLDW